MKIAQVLSRLGYLTKKKLFFGLADPKNHQFATSVCQYSASLDQLFLSVFHIQGKTNQNQPLNASALDKSFIIFSEFIVISRLCCLGTNRKNEDCKAIILKHVSSAIEPIS